MKKLMVVVSAIALGTASSVHAAENGLVAHFTFDDATKFGYDSVQKKTIGTVYNSSFWGSSAVGPKECDAPHVRGLKVADGWWQNNTMVVPDWAFGSAQGIPYGTADITYSLWINPTSGWQTDSHLGMGTAGHVLIHGFHGLFIRKGDGDKPKLVFSANASATDSSAASYQLAQAFDGRWHHVVVTSANRSLQIFYDGELVAAKTLDADVSNPDGAQLVFGSSFTSGNEFATYCERRYAGSIDDIRVYSRILTADEVRTVYQAGATPYDTDVLAWDGASAGGAVEDVGNWTTKSNRRTAGEIYATGIVEFDVTPLGEGGTLTHDADATLNLKGVVCTGGQEEVTFEMKQGTLVQNRLSTQRGLVTHLSFDDPADMLHESCEAGLNVTSSSWMSPSHTGEVLPAQSVDGASGKALYFPGSGQPQYWPSPYLRVGGDKAAEVLPKGNEAITYSLWIKPYAVGLWNNDMTGLASNGPIWIFRRGTWGDGKSNYLWLQKGNGNGRLYWSIANYMEDSGTCTYDPPNLFDGNWHHMVCVYESKVLTLYYDGVKVATKETAYGLDMTWGASVSFGNSTTSGDDDENYRRYLGGFDEVKIFNVALTDDEVAAEYAQHSQTLDCAGSSPSPVKLQLDTGTAAAVGGYFEYGSLSGAGALSLGPASLLKLDGIFDFAGAVTGCGSVKAANLVLGGDTSALIGDFIIGENAAITVPTLNGQTAVATFGGKVVLPAKASVALPAGLGLEKSALIEAGSIVPPADFSQWTATVDGKTPTSRVKFSVDGNKLQCRLAGGIVITVR